MNNFYCYVYMRSIDGTFPAGTPYYVGKGKGKRAYTKSGHSSIPTDKADIVIVADNLSEEDAFEREKMLIEFFGRADLGTGCLRNLTDGGDGASGQIKPLEAIAKTVAFHTGRKRSEETCRNISLALAGKNFHSDEGKAKMSADRTGEGNARCGTKIPSASSQYMGVSVLKRSLTQRRKTTKYQAYVTVNKKLTYIGVFETEELAARARDQYVIDNDLPQPLNFSNTSVSSLAS